MFTVQSLSALAVGEVIGIGASGITDVLLYELAMGFALGWFLHLRRWRLVHLGFEPLARQDASDAVMLLAAVYAISILAQYLASLGQGMIITGGDPPAAAGAVSLIAIIAFSCVNAVFEEVFVCAYLLRSLRRWPMWDAISASALLRIGYHLYQDAVSVAIIGALGLLFAWFYATRDRIWPLILAHAILDLLYLLPFARL